MKNFLLFIFLAPCLTSFSQDAGSSQSIDPKAPFIKFETVSHDFGDLKRGSPVVYKFKYKNTGKEPLVIYDCKAGCGCTTPKCSKEPLKHNKSAYIEVHYDSLRIGKFKKEVMISSNAANGTQSVIIMGNIIGESEGKDPALLQKKESDGITPAVPHNE